MQLLKSGRAEFSQRLEEAWLHFHSVSPYQVQYKKGHDERVSTFTPVADTPELLRAKAGGQLQNDVRNDAGGPGRWVSGPIRTRV